MENNYGYTYTPEPKKDGTSVLVFGILALALGGIFGIIFGAIATHKAKAFPESEQVGKVKAGKILGTIGLIFGIIFVVTSVVGTIAGAFADLFGILGLGFLAAI